MATDTRTLPENAAPPDDDTVAEALYSLVLREAQDGPVMGVPAQEWSSSALAEGTRAKWRTIAKAAKAVVMRTGQPNTHMYNSSANSANDSTNGNNTARVHGDSRTALDGNLDGSKTKLQHTEDAKKRPHGHTDGGAKADAAEATKDAHNQETTQLVGTPEGTGSNAKYAAGNLDGNKTEDAAHNGGVPTDKAPDAKHEKQGFFGKKHT